MGQSYWGGGVTGPQLQSESPRLSGQMSLTLGSLTKVKMWITHICYKPLYQSGPFNFLPSHLWPWVWSPDDTGSKWCEKSSPGQTVVPEEGSHSTLLLAHGRFLLEGKSWFPGGFHICLPAHLTYTQITWYLSLCWQMEGLDFLLKDQISALTA